MEEYKIPEPNLLDSNESTDENVKELLITGLSDYEGLEISIDYDNRPTVTFVFPKDTEALLSSGEEIFLDRVKKIFATLDIELGDALLLGSNIMKFRFNKKFEDGKINWRRWIPYPEKFSDKNIGILDEISTFTEIAEVLEDFKSDGFGKFSRFVKVARVRGLINDDELRHIESEYYAVAHGY